MDRQQLHRLLEAHAALLSHCRITDPTRDELPALAAILHSFYNGIENIFKRIAVALDGGTPRGPSWHAELIDSMQSPRPHRPPLLPKALSETLQEYLDFRHVFRQAYSFELRWSKMRQLVFEMGNVLPVLEQEIDRFLEALHRPPS